MLIQQSPRNVFNRPRNHWRLHKARPIRNLAPHRTPTRSAEMAEHRVSRVARICRIHAHQSKLLPNVCEDYEPSYTLSDSRPDTTSMLSLG